MVTVTVTVYPAHTCPGHVLSLYYQLLFILCIRVYSALAERAYFIARDWGADVRRITKVPVSFYLNDRRHRFFKIYDGKKLGYTLILLRCRIVCTHQTGSYRS